MIRYLKMEPQTRRIDEIIKAMCKTLRLSDSCWCYFSQKLNEKLNNTKLKRDDYQMMQRVILKNIFLVVTRSTNTQTDLQKKKKTKLIVDSRQQPPHVFTSGPNICFHFVYRFFWHKQPSNMNRH